MINLFYSRYYAQKCAEDMGLSKYVVVRVRGIKRIYYRIYLPLEGFWASSRYLALRLAESKGLDDVYIKRVGHGDETYYRVYTPFLCATVKGDDKHD